jgi:hypothetical protein
MMMRIRKPIPAHTFLNVFLFRGGAYIAEALVKADEEDISLVIDPAVPGDLEDELEEFLVDWLREVVDCHVELRKTVV